MTDTYREIYKSIVLRKYDPHNKSEKFEFTLTNLKQWLMFYFCAAVAFISVILRSYIGHSCCEI